MQVEGMKYLNCKLFTGRPIEAKVANKWSITPKEYCHKKK